MKKTNLTFVLMVIAMLAFTLTSCNLFKSPSLEDRVWQVESIEITSGGTTVTTTFPKTLTIDFDGDGTQETERITIYQYYNADTTTAYIFNKIEVLSDGGTATGSFTGSLTYTTDTYSLSDTTLTIGTDSYTVEVSQSNATLTIINSGSTPSGSTHLKAVSSPTFEELLAQATAE